MTDPDRPLTSSPSPAPTVDSPTSAPASGDQVGEDSRTTTLVRYLEANRAAFTEDALIDAALAAGYERSDVDVALAKVRAAEAPPAAIGTETTPSRASAGSAFAMLLTVAYVMAILLAMFGAALATNPRVFASERAWLIFLIYVAAMALGGLVSIRRLLRVSSRDEGAAATFVPLGVSVGLFIGLSGLCVAGVSVP